MAQAELHLPFLTLRARGEQFHRGQMPSEYQESGFNFRQLFPAGKCSLLSKHDHLKGKNHSRTEDSQPGATGASSCLVNGVYCWDAKGNRC